MCNIYKKMGRSNKNETGLKLHIESAYYRKNVRFLQYMYRGWNGKKYIFLAFKNKIKKRTMWVRVIKIIQRSINIRKIVTRKKSFSLADGRQKKDDLQK